MSHLAHGNISSIFSEADVFDFMGTVLDNNLLGSISVYKDKNTPSPFIENFENDVTGESTRARKPDHVYLDAMGFGMGCSCLQMTFQAYDINEARLLYDNLTPLTPVIVSFLFYLSYFYKLHQNLFKRTQFA